MTTISRPEQKHAWAAKLIACGFNRLRMGLIGYRRRGLIG
jgi:hypothetical protein